MTDKQIIIEDCPYFVNGVCMEYLDGACENHKCDLKIIRELEQKLKAKEQECEGLRYEVGSLENDRDILKEQLDQLKAELTRANCQIADDEILQCDMREAIEGLKAENDELKETFDGLLKIQYKLADNCKKLRQCLTEIKEIAEAHKKDESVWNPYRQLDKILQKISECEVNDV